MAKCTEFAVPTLVAADSHPLAGATGRAGARRFVSFHVLVPGEWAVQRGHDLLEAIESEVRAAPPNATVFTHLEPVEDPSSWDDAELDRGTATAARHKRQGPPAAAPATD